jgi:hypothetical protein
VDIYVRHIPSGKDYVGYVPTKPPRAPVWQPREFVRGIVRTTGKHADMAVPVPANCFAVAARLPDLTANPVGASANQPSPKAGQAPAAVLPTAKLGTHSNQLGQICRVIEVVLGLPRGTEVTLEFFKNLLYRANQRVFSDLVFDHESYGYVVRYSKAESVKFIADVKRQLPG